VSGRVVLVIMIVAAIAALVLFGQLEMEAHGRCLEVRSGNVCNYAMR
jgi:hypothetical protein